VRAAHLLPLLLVACTGLDGGHPHTPGERTIAPDLARIDDAKLWSVTNGEFHAAVEDGKSALRLAPIGSDGPGSNVAMALVAGVDFAEGTIDVDLKGHAQQRTFLGVTFDVLDEKKFEAVYFRPFNFRPDDAEHRVRAVQYVSWPDHTWEALRAKTPGIYEHAVDPVPDPSGWFHARIEVTTKQVSVFVDDAKKPCLVVNRLGKSGKGGVGLWVDSHEGAFANLKIRPTT
jgi:hypothetical protein